MTDRPTISRLAATLLLTLPLLACGDASSGDPDGSSADTGAASDESPTGDEPTDSGLTGGSGSMTGGSESGEATDGVGEPGTPVELGDAGDYVLLAKTSISSVPDVAVTGDLGLSPAAASYITGFSLIADPTNVHSTSSQVTGKVYAADYEPPTPSKLTSAVGDMELAFTDAAGRAPGTSELGAGDIGGMTLPAGVYRWSTGLLIPTDVSLGGSSTDVWIFQVASDLTLADGVEIALTDGALPANVFWQVSGQVTLGTTAHLEGVVLAQTSVTLGTGASLTGRLLAQTAIELGASAVVGP